MLELPYWDAQEFFEERAYPNRYQETSLFARDITDDFIYQLFQIWPTWPKTVSAARLTAYRVGGKVNTVAPDAMAFVHRNYQWMVTTDIDWSDPWATRTRRGTSPGSGVCTTPSVRLLGGPGSYQNFPDPALDDHAKAYWGSNLARLSQIKNKYDPDSVFAPPRNQGIPFPLAGAC